MQALKLRYSLIFTIYFFGNLSWSMASDIQEQIKTSLEKLEFPTRMREIIESKTSLDVEKAVVTYFLRKYKEDKLLRAFKPFSYKNLPKKNFETVRALNVLYDEMRVFVQSYNLVFESLMSNKVIEQRHHRQNDGSLVYITNEEKVKAYPGELENNFLLFQRISNLFMGIIMHYKYDGLIAHPCGVLEMLNKDELIGFFKDSGGFVLFPVDKQQQPYRVVLSYGDLQSQNFHSFIIDQNAQLLDEKVIFVSRISNANFPLEMGLYNGLLSELPARHGEDLRWFFSRSHISNWQILEDRSQRLLASAFLAEINLDKLTDQDCVYFSVPVTPQDFHMIELLFIEDLIESDDDNFAHQIVSDMKMSLLEYKQNLDLLVAHDLTSENNGENSPLLEQNSHPKEPKYKKKQAQTKRVEEKKVTQQKFEAWKVKGRQKWRHVLKLVNSIVKEYPNLKLAEISIRGSHITLHSPSAQSVTIAPKHGSKDLTMPESTVNNFVEKLLVFALSK